MFGFGLVWIIFYLSQQSAVQGLEQGIWGTSHSTGSTYLRPHTRWNIWDLARGGRGSGVKLKHWTFDGSGKSAHYSAIWKCRKPQIFVLSRHRDRHSHTIPSKYLTEPLIWGTWGTSSPEAEAFL